MSKSNVKWLVLVGVLAIGASAFASPVINSAVLTFRTFDDDPDSIVTFGDAYPASIFIQDSKLDGGGPGTFANRHNFKLSENDFTPAVFNNADGWAFYTDVTLTGSANEEGGIEVSPWWDTHTAGGVFTAITGNGEIAAFSGRLPFYSFNNHVPPVNYVKGETIRLGIRYNPHSLTQADPGTIEYLVWKNNVMYSSGVIAFDEGNAAEGKGTWGLLDDHRVGGYFQPQLQVGNADNMGRVDFGNMVYVPEPGAMALLAVVGLGLLRRGR